LPIAASFVVASGLLIFFAIYCQNYRQRDAYITSRNFRLLAVLAKQTESTINDYTHNIVATQRLPAQPIGRRLDLGDGGATLTLVLGSTSTKPPVGTIDSILGEVFRKKTDQGAFDTLALAEPGGRVAFAVGRRGWEISSTNLSALLPGTEGAGGDLPAKEPASHSKVLFASIRVLDVVIAGVPYKMYVQPCCQLVTQASGQAGAVVVGLVAADVLRREAMAISPTLVVITTLLIVLALLVWPFLNVTLQGPRKRLTPWDAVQLGFSGTLGLAIATILAVTSMQCARLERDLGGQLEALADALDRELTAEIESSARTLDAFEAWLAACPKGPGRAGYRVEKACQPTHTPRSREIDVGQYRNYAVAALVDETGQQQRKAWQSQKPPPLVPVTDRPYFQAAIQYSRDQGLMTTLQGDEQIDCMGPPCFLDSVVSYTTGKPSAVLARPSRVKSLPVAAITLPMRSVIEPVLPAGFEFAVIEQNGRVVFHSDVQRNTFEDLFLETDRNPQLRSLVATGVNGRVRMEYWGRPYIAHVKHTQAYGWSIVTLFDRRTLRGLMLEWTMVSVLLLALYIGLWALALSVAVTGGTSWLWPDRFRGRRYWLLALFYIALLMAFGFAVASSSFERSAIGMAGFILPAVACAGTFMVLKSRPAARIGSARLEYRLDYCVPAALLLVVIGVLPGAAFVARSYDAHIEAYLKHRQLGIARTLLKQPPSGAADGLPATRDLERPQGWHSRFLYGMSLCRETRNGASADAAASTARIPACAGVDGQRGAAPTAAARWAVGGRDPFWLLETHLPYFSEMSVQIRKLVTQHADDGSWWSARDGRWSILRVPSPNGSQPEAVLATTTLPPLAISELAGAVLMAMVLVLGALAYGIAYFIARHVFLGQVSAPPWAVGRLAIPEGKTVVLVCDAAAMAGLIHGAIKLSLSPIVLDPDPQAALSRALERSPAGHSGRPILVTDLDAGANDAIAAKAALLPSLTRSRAVLALSTRAPSQLTEVLRKDENLAGLEAACAVERALELFENRDLIVLDWSAHPGATAGPLALSSMGGIHAWWRRLRTLAWSGVERGQYSGPRREREPVGEPLLCSEERAHSHLRSIAADIRRLDAFRSDRMSRTEILEEVDERAEALYCEIWKLCSDEEKLELRHIAQFGLANQANRRAVRQLVSKRLVTKDPELRLMNRSFRRFVLLKRSLGTMPQTDVARIESELALSSWDRFRVPFALVMFGVAAFLYLTQRETYNVIVGAAVPLATLLPNLLKAMMFVAHRDPAPPITQRNA
jgi:hypothetical protein